MEDKDVLMTGDVARICRVSPPTVIKWIDGGLLKGYTIPGSRTRRITRMNLINFMKEHGIPLIGLVSVKRRILIVEDDESLCEMLAKVFEQYEYFIETRFARSGFEAGVAVKSFRPHVLVVDIVLGEEDGREVVRILREDPQLATMRVIAMSGIIPKEELKDLLNAGYDDILSKPFTMAELVQKIGQLLEIELPAPKIDASKKKKK